MSIILLPDFYDPGTVVKLQNAQNALSLNFAWRNRVLVAEECDQA
jgi:hypothetical protein